MIIKAYQLKPGDVTSGLFVTLGVTLLSNRAVAVTYADFKCSKFYVTSYHWNQPLSILSIEK